MELLKPANKTMIFYLNFLILYIQGNSAFPNLSLHGQNKSTLLKQNLKQEFSNDDPKYEIVQIRILSKRSIDDQNIIRIHLSAFRKDIHLRLQRNDDFNYGVKKAKFYKAEFNGTNIQLTEVICEDEDPGTPYIDPVHMAAITIRHGPDGQLLMDGVIGDDLLIKPAPMEANYPDDSIIYDYYIPDYILDTFNSSRNYPSDFGNSSSSFTEIGAHIVYRSIMKTNSVKVALDDVINNIIDSDDDNDERHRKRPLHAWPEVLLMVDYDTYAMHLSHGLNDTQIRRYYVSFMNGVDLRFKILSDPKISLILSQIVVFKSRDDSPYLKENFYSYLNTFDGHNAISDLSHHMYTVKMQQQHIYPEFDMAILMTKLDMCSNDFFRCNPSTVGLAYHMGACNINHKVKRFMGVGIVEDHGGFDGILTAAHEIGHLLGADHDGSNLVHPDPRYALFCREEDGYMMSNKMTSNRIFQWSECSIKQIRLFLSSHKATCLFNHPSYHNELEKGELPGAVLSLDEQCGRIWGTTACAWDSRVCLSLHCCKPTDRIIEVSDPLSMLPPAAEGSSCGENLHCRHGRCVSTSLTYSQAWNMVPGFERWEYKDSPTVSTTKMPQFVEEDCTDRDEIFCDNYFWTIGRKEACKNSRVQEECCYSHVLFC